MKYCKNCGQEMDDRATVCANCGTAEKKPKKSIFKRWWFWVIVGIVLITIVSGGSGDKPAEGTPTETQQVSEEQTTTQAPTTEGTIAYESVSLQQMVEDLESNAMKAEKTYQDLYIEVSGQISNFDSDGAYISIKPENADVWSFTSITCRIHGQEQTDFLMNKSIGDMVIIKGQVSSVGELLGYTIEIDEVY